MRRGRRWAVAVTIGVGEYADLATLAAREVQDRTAVPAALLGEREFAKSGLEHPDAVTVCLADWDPSPL